MIKRKKCKCGFNTKVILEALQKRETFKELTKKYELHPTQISTWNCQFLSSASLFFEKGVDKTSIPVSKEPKKYRQGLNSN